MVEWFAQRIFYCTYVKLLDSTIVTAIHDILDLKSLVTVIALTFPTLKPHQRCFVEKVGRGWYLPWWAMHSVKPYHY